MELTREQIEEAYEKYKDVPLFFNSYYKYTFHFKGVEDDGAIICRAIGGESGDLYKYEVSSDKPETLEYIQLDSCTCHYTEEENKLSFFEDNY